MIRRVALAAGGTAGHVRPALAIAAAYQQHVPGAEVIFIGASGGFEADLATANGYCFERIESLPIARAGGKARVQALNRFYVGVHQARRLLRGRRIELAIGFGGYASASTVVAARSLGLPTVIFECNASAGLGNLLLNPFASAVFLGFAECRRYFPGRRPIVCGLPILFREAAGRRRGVSNAAEWSRRLLVLGGSQGSAFLNRRAPELVAALAQRGCAFEVIHQCGAGNEAETADNYRRAGMTSTVIPFIDDMERTYQWADFALTGAGASTLAELAAAGLPALIVPIAAAAWNHQLANAQTFANASGLPWTSEREWCSQSLADDLVGLLCDPARLSQLTQALLALRRDNAAQVVVQQCERLLGAAG